MDNAITFQMRSAEREEDLGELWERMQANLTAVSSSRARDRAALGATNLPLPSQVLPLSPGPAWALCWQQLRDEGERREHMVSPETEGTACRAAKSQSASVSPGKSHVTSAAGQSRVPHMAAVGGSWPRSWGRSCLIASPPWQGEGEPCCSIPTARGPSSHARREAWAEPWAEPSAGSGGGNGAKEHAFGAVQHRGGTSHCSPSQCRNPRIAPAR